MHTICCKRLNGRCLNLIPPVSPFNKIIKRLTLKSEITFITSSTFLKLKTSDDSHVPPLFSLLTIIFAINSCLDVNRLAARISFSHTLILAQPALFLHLNSSREHNSANCQQLFCMSPENAEKKKSFSAEMMCAQSVKYGSRLYSWRTYARDAEGFDRASSEQPSQ